VSGDGVVTAPEGTAAELAETFAASNPGDSRRRTLVWQDPVPTAAAGATMSGMEYMTAVTTLRAGVAYTSLGLEAKYVRPITRDTGRVLCEATVLYRGRRQATAEATLTAADSGKLLAHGTSTLMILDPAA
jgi:acyl-coenzyme A thioesterase PaaI-like protein